MKLAALLRRKRKSNAAPLSSTPVEVVPSEPQAVTAEPDATPSEPTAPEPTTTPLVGVTPESDMSQTTTIEAVESPSVLPLPQSNSDQKFLEPSVIFPSSLTDSSLYQSQIVKVAVGGDRAPFYLHKPILCQQIPYFAGLLNPSWNKDEVETIDLDFVDIDAFRIVAHWAYAKKLPDGFAKSTNEAIGAPNSFLPDNVLAAYKAADQLMISSLQNALVDLLLDCYCDLNLYFCFGDLALICEYDLSHTPLYQLALKAATQNLGNHAPDCECSARSKLDRLLEYPEVLKEIVLVSASYVNYPKPDIRTGERSEWYMSEVHKARFANQPWSSDY